MSTIPGLFLAVEGIVSLGGQFVSYHSNGVTGQQGRHVQNHVVRSVGQQVDDGNDGHGDCNGQGQVP